ncbi:hypothetical protein [Sphaerisporangium sp. NPDC051011]|uniref:hypothetical protein n=1 Tax=Sphaerisporangium sp. NPDC051011 TaxID=3155792 RepID=UPI0033F6E44D
MRVIGAAFGRTGRLSLKAALERLGFAEPFPRRGGREDFGRHTCRYLLRAALRLSPARGRRPPVLPVIPGGRRRR